MGAVRTIVTVLVAAAFLLAASCATPLAGEPGLIDPWASGDDRASVPEAKRPEAHGCWPGQGWDGKQCTGIPARCPTDDEDEQARPEEDGLMLTP